MRTVLWGMVVVETIFAISVPLTLGLLQWFGNLQAGIEREFQERS